MMHKKKGKGKGPNIYGQRIFVMVIGKSKQWMGKLDDLNKETAPSNGLVHFLVVMSRSIQ